MYYCRIHGNVCVYVECTCVRVYKIKQSIQDTAHKGWYRAYTDKQTIRQAQCQSTFFNSTLYASSDNKWFIYYEFLIPMYNIFVIPIIPTHAYRYCIVLGVRFRDLTFANFKLSCFVWNRWACTKTFVWKTVILFA